MAREQKPPKYRELKEQRQMNRKLKSVTRQQNNIAATKQRNEIEAEISEAAASEGDNNVI
jgi:hypothetical protein